MQLHPDDSNWGKEKELLQNKGLIGLGEWEEKAEQQSNFKDLMDIGDIVMIKNGKQLVALTEVIGPYEYNDEPGELDWFQHRRRVKVLDWYKREYNFKVAPRGTLTRCRIENEDSDTNNSIISWYERLTKMKNVIEIRQVLEQKKQVILQGPPGTGKTRLAKLIAEDMIHETQVGDSKERIHQFMSSFDATQPDIQAARTARANLLDNFRNAFRADTLKDISLAEYCAGRGDRENFCWWIETGLKSLGRYSPGSALSYLIYWSKEKQDYVITDKVKSIASTPEDAIVKIAQALYTIAFMKRPQEIVKLMGDSYILKILNSYYPEEYFPINGKKMLNNALRIFGVDPSRLDALEMNKKLIEIFNSKRNEYNVDMDAFEFAGFLWNNFDLKTGSDIDEDRKVVSKGDFKLVQFHPAYSYEDFVRGIVASSTAAGIEYKTENKIFAELAIKASENPNSNYVLIIDEINRANLPSVMGELIYGLEYRGQPINTMYELNDDRELSEPNNLFIIGTMNSADRSVGHIDYAIRRRFAFVDVEPDETVITTEEGRLLFKAIVNIFKKHQSLDFRFKDVMIGHSYFMEDDPTRLKVRLQYEIKPILFEYIKDGILPDAALTEIEQLSV